MSLSNHSLCFFGAIKLRHDFLTFKQQISKKYGTKLEEMVSYQSA